MAALQAWGAPTKKQNLKFALKTSTVPTVGFPAPVITTPALNVAAVETDAAESVVLPQPLAGVVRVQVLWPSSETADWEASPPARGEIVARSWDGLGPDPPVGVIREFRPVVIGRIEVGPAETAATRVVKHRRKANATRFFCLLMLMTLFQGNYLLIGLLGR